MNLMLKKQDMRMRNMKPGRVQDLKKYDRTQR